jgi:hypothetical protein
MAIGLNSLLAARHLQSVPDSKNPRFGEVK